MPYPLFHVDAFTDKPFAGNPAAVCILPRSADEAWMQAVAAEMNLSETAFLAPHEDPFKRAYRLRWFTPQVEVALCGHATLASAHVLWTEGYFRPPEMIRFITQSGELTATRDSQEWVTLDFPARGLEEVAVPAGLLEALGLNTASYVGRNPINDHLIEVADEAAIHALTPDFAALAQVAVRGVMVTSQAHNAAYQFVSRYFNPSIGINEDPVTGSAHCCLAPYWCAKFGQDSLVGYQASARGGLVRVQHVGERVKLAGQAVTVVKGKLIG